jgi:hypothetical protein
MLNYYSNLDINGYKNCIKNYDISNNVDTIILYIEQVQVKLKID